MVRLGLRQRLWAQEKIASACHTLGSQWRQTHLFQLQKLKQSSTKHLQFWSPMDATRLKIHRNLLSPSILPLITSPSQTASRSIPKLGSPFFFLLPLKIRSLYLTSHSIVFALKSSPQYNFVCQHIHKAHSA